MSARFHPYLCGRNAAEWLIDMTMLEAFVKERNEALFSLDRKKIEAYMIKYGETEISQTPDTVFWASVYKAICGIKDAPEAVEEGNSMAARA